MQTNSDTADTCVCLQTHSDTFRHSRNIQTHRVLLANGIVRVMGVNGVIGAIGVIGENGTRRKEK